MSTFEKNISIFFEKIKSRQFKYQSLQHFIYPLVLSTLHYYFEQEFVYIQVCLHFFLQVSFPPSFPASIFKVHKQSRALQKKRLRYVIIIRAMTLNEGLAINDVTPFLRFLIFSSSSLSPILPNRKTYSEMLPLEIPSFPHRRRRHLCILAFLQYLLVKQATNYIRINFAI